MLRPSSSLLLSAFLDQLMPEPKTGIASAVAGAVRSVCFVLAGTLSAKGTGPDVRVFCWWTPPLSTASNDEDEDIDDNQSVDKERGSTDEAQVEKPTDNEKAVVNSQTLMTDPRKQIAST